MHLEIQMFKLSLSFEISHDRYKKLKWQSQNAPKQVNSKNEYIFRISIKFQILDTHHDLFRAIQNYDLGSVCTYRDLKTEIREKRPIVSKND